METSQIFTIISIVILVVITLFRFFLPGNKDRKLTPLAALAFGFVLSGIIFSGVRLIGYSLIGVGVILAIIDIVKKMSSK